MQSRPSLKAGYDYNQLVFYIITRVEKPAMNYAKTHQTAPPK